MQLFYNRQSMLYRGLQGNQKYDLELDHDKLLSNNVYILGLPSETDHDRLAKMQGYAYQDLYKTLARPS